MEIKKLLLCLLLFLFVSCVTIAKIPYEKDASIIGMTVWLDKFPFSMYPTSVFFVKVNDNENFLNGNEIIKTNYSYGERVYLLNPKPGKYYAVAAYEKTTNQSGKVTMTDYTNYYFPVKLIELTEANIKNNEAVYLGHYTVDVPFRWSYSGINKPDEAQFYYCKKLQPNKLEWTAEGCCLEGCMAFISRKRESALAVNIKEIKKDLKSESIFWEKTRLCFAGNSNTSYDKESIEANKGWIELIDRKIQQLKSKEKNIELK
ncbi:MAG: hypothetical protein V1874_12885 [Spirochaetota bacterium]